MKLIKLCKKFIKEKLKNQPNDIKHARLTAKWIKKLKPDADEALLVAGLLHDIERAFYGDWKKGSIDPKKIQTHHDLSALETEKFLKDIGAPGNFIRKVESLVANHTWGGDEEQNILCDADCLASLQDKAPRWFRESKTTEQKEKTKKRILRLYERIKTTQGKHFADKFCRKILNLTLKS